MAEQNEGGEVVSFMAEQFRRLNGRFDQVEQQLQALDGKFEARFANVERRLTAQTHFEQSMVAHLASIHSGVDNLRADFIGIEQRLAKVEGS